MSNDGKNSSFALRLKQHRELCSLTQQQVADILNINRTTYTKYETGVSEPSHEVLKKIVSIFGTDYNSLFGDNSPFTPVVEEAEINLGNLTADEKNLVIAYRTMSDYEKKSFLVDAVQSAMRKRRVRSDKKSNNNK